MEFVEFRNATKGEFRCREATNFVARFGVVVELLVFELLKGRYYSG